MIFDYCDQGILIRAEKTKYLRWYLQLMARAIDRGEIGLSERHHVVPKSLGGANGSTVLLTFREHFLAHWLLTKVVRGEAKRKMLYALGCLMRSGKWHTRKLTGRQYEIARTSWRDACKGRKVSDETRKRMSEAAKNRGEEYSIKMSLAQKGRKLSDETKAKLSNFMKNIPEDVRERMDAPRRGRSWGKHTEATRRKISDAAYARYVRANNE